MTNRADVLNKLMRIAIC